MKRRIEPWIDSWWKKFVRQINALKTEAALNSFLKTILNTNEQRNIAARIEAIEAFESGATYLEIENKVGLSSQTISSIRKALNSKIYKSYREREETDRKKKGSWSLLPDKPPRHDPMKRPHKHKSGTFYY